MILSKVLAVADKEMRQARRDPITLAMLIGMPALFLLLYGYALNFDVRNVPIGVIDLDKSAHSRELVASFVNSTFFDQVADLPAGTDVEAFFQRRKAKGVLVIPPDFGREIDAGRPVRRLSVTRSSSKRDIPVTASGRTSKAFSLIFR